MNSLITKALETKTIGPLLSFPKSLLSAFEVSLIDWISDFTIRFGEPPSLERLKEHTDLFLPIPSSDPLGDLYERELVRKRNLHTRDYLISMQEDLKKGVDPLPAIRKLYETINAGGDDVLMYRTHDRTEYLREKVTYPFGVNILDRHTGGATEGDLIYVIGRLASGKSTFALWLVNRWFLDGYRVLVVSNEMRADDVVAKLDAFIGGWNPLKKRTMEWSEGDKHRLATTSFIASKSDGEVIVPVRPALTTTKIQSFIHAYKPQIVLIDGVYLMNENDGNSMWERVTDISRSLKRLAVSENVPIIGVHQSNRASVGKRVEIENAAYSDAIGQDADLVLGINKEDDGNVFVEAIKNRWGGDFGFFVRFFFDTMTVTTYDTAKTA